MPLQQYMRDDNCYKVFSHALMAKHHFTIVGLLLAGGTASLVNVLLHEGC